MAYEYFRKMELCSAKSQTSPHINGGLGLDTRIADKFCRYFPIHNLVIVVLTFSFAVTASFLSNLCGYYNK